jgi:hypothetical protein
MEQIQGTFVYSVSQLVPNLLSNQRTTSDRTCYAGRYPRPESLPGLPGFDKLVGNQR